MAFWNRIIGWFKDLSERDKLIKDFNLSARDSFARLSVSTLLSAYSKQGKSENWHECSNFLLKGGFCIKAISGRPLTKEEMLYIGEVILGNTTLTRRLFILGWDTLYIEDIVGRKQVCWAIKDFAQMEMLLK